MPDQLYSPTSEDNPYRIQHAMKTREEWVMMALWYPFSLRVLIELNGNWLEVARCSSRDNAYHLLKDVQAQHPRDYYVVVQMLRMGKEGREKAILFAPGENAVNR